MDYIVPVNFLLPILCLTGCFAELDTSVFKHTHRFCEDTWCISDCITYLCLQPTISMYATPLLYGVRALSLSCTRNTRGYIYTDNHENVQPRARTNRAAQVVDQRAQSTMTFLLRYYFYACPLRRWRLARVCFFVCVCRGVG